MRCCAPYDSWMELPEGTAWDIAETWPSGYPRRLRLERTADELEAEPEAEPVELDVGETDPIMGPGVIRTPSR